MQLLIINVTVVWIAVYLLTALILLIIEYRGITIPYCKKQFAYIMGFLISIGIMYCFYFRQDPIQVFQMYSAEYIHFGGLLYTTTFGMNVSRWVIFSAFTMVFGIFGFFSLRNYTMLEQQEVEGDLMIQKKFDMASRGISVFVHGMKNQLLSNRVLCDRIKNEFAKEEPDIAKIRQYSEGISDTNTNMLKRMEELYKSIKSNYLTLHPVDVSEVLDRALYRFHEKYPDVVVGISIETTSQLLADLSHLSEACYNLLINGYEAILESGKEIQHLAIRVYDERLYVTFVISDNGKGMSRRVQKKIYDPFYTSKNTNNNWGMGLYYVRQIIKSHMGILRVESAEGEGTKFFVSIPKYGTQTKGRKQHDKNTDS